MPDKEERGVEIRVKGSRYLLYLDGWLWEEFDSVSEAKKWRDVLRERRGGERKPEDDTGSPR